MQQNRAVPYQKTGNAGLDCEISQSDLLQRYVKRERQQADFSYESHALDDTLEVERRLKVDKRRSATAAEGASHQTEQAKTAPVEQALELFDQLSTKLTASYRSLQKRVNDLRDELSQEEQQRRTELKHKEQLAARLSALLELLPAGVVVLDGNGKVTDCNPAALELLGEPLEGQQWFDVIRRCFAPRRDDGHEVSLIDGRRVRIETRSLKDWPGQLILLSDLTETRALQEQVSRAERLSSLGRMVASLAHQIRTPLSTAMLYAGHLSQPGMEEKMRIECAEKVMSRLTHLEHQIRDMLVFAKGETRLAERVSAIELINGMRASVEANLHKAGVIADWKVNSADVEILCNRETLIGACVNLINNAVEAFEHDKALNIEDLKLQIRCYTRANMKLVIEIEDNGPGITEANQQRILEPFYTTKSHGTGLGLAVVQAVAKAHHGEFSIRSSTSKQAAGGQDQSYIQPGTVAAIELPLFRRDKFNRGMFQSGKSGEEVAPGSESPERKVTDNHINSSGV